MVTRRGFVRRMGLLGFSIAASSTLLAACAEEGSGGPTDGQEPSSGGSFSGVCDELEPSPPPYLPDHPPWLNVLHADSQCAFGP